MSTLSARFATLKNSGAKAGNTGGGIRPRVQQSAAAQKNKRAAQNQARRTGGAPQIKKTQGSARPVRGVGKPSTNGAKKNLRRNGKGRKGRKGGKPGDKKTPSTAADLDTDMDRYWHAAGKGPDPDVASLDREMDDYFKNKGANNASAEVADAAPMVE